jgi:hypothetical protein
MKASADTEPGLPKASLMRPSRMANSNCFGNGVEGRLLPMPEAVLDLTPVTVVEVSLHRSLAEFGVDSPVVFHRILHQSEEPLKAEWR